MVTNFLSARTHAISRFGVFSAKSFLGVYLSQFADHMSCLLMGQGLDPPMIYAFYWQVVVNEM